MLRRIIPVLVGVGVLIGLIVLIVAKLTALPPSAFAPVAAAPTSPSPASTPTRSPPPTATPTSDQPSDDQVWRLEEADLLPDPQAREQALADLATPDYVASQPYTVVLPTAAAGMSFRVDRTQSKAEPHPGSTPSSCYVITYPVIVTMRDGVTLNTYAASAHTTEWVKTPGGWRALRHVTTSME